MHDAQRIWRSSHAAAQSPVRLLSGAQRLLLVALIPGRSESQVGIPPDKTTPQEILTRARAFEAEKQYDQAVASYRAYLVVRPEDDEVRGSLARLLSWQGAYDEAITLYENILTRHPLDFEVRVALARVQAWHQNFTEARRLYEACSTKMRRISKPGMVWPIRSTGAGSTLPHCRTMRRCLPRPPTQP